MNTRLAALLLSAGAACAAADGGKEQWPAHEDHTNLPPVQQTGQAQSCADGVSAGYACRNIELAGHLSTEDLWGGTGADSWGWADPQTGRRYAIVALSNGTSFVDVTDPENPVFLGHMASTSGDQPWRDVKVHANHAFVVADSIPGHGMQVFRLPRLRQVETPRNFQPNTTYMEVGSAHNIAINEASGFAYIVGSDTCDGGLHMVDVSTPAAPEFAGCYAGDGYTHDVQCVLYSGPDPGFQGSEICFAANEDSLTVVDVTDKSNPTLLSKASYPMTGYSHQGWLTDDHAVFFMGDEVDEQSWGVNTRTLVFDVSNLQDAHYDAAYVHATSTIDHNLYVRGDLLYQANYEAGLRILRIGDAHSAGLIEVGYFDTYPNRDARGFNGAWNVYPFFDDDVLIVSDFNAGLFVLKTHLQPGAPSATPGATLDGATSGAWSSPDLSDQGLMLLVGDNDAGRYVFFTWFLYLEGDPFWLTGSAPLLQGAESVLIPTQSLSGLQFLLPGDGEATRTDVGTLLVHAHECEVLHLEYDFGDLGAGEIEMEKVGSVQGRECHGGESHH